MKLHAFYILQQYFSLNTKQRLRNSLILHALFFLLFSISLLSTSSIYASFLESTCPRFASFASMLAFFDSILPTKENISYIFAACYILITTISFSFTLLSLCTLIWEDIIRATVTMHSQIRQLHIVQVCFQ